MNIKRRSRWNGIKIPPFTTTLFEGSKLVPDETVSLAKRLLLTVRDNPQTLLNKNIADNALSISDQLALLYIKSVERGKIRDGSFMKCNFLEDLVISKNMSYIILCLYPAHYAISIKDADKVKHVYDNRYSESHILNCVDDEHIPCMVLDWLFEMTALSNWNLFYDNHMIVKIQKFLSNDTAPVCSFFVLLKPTNQTNSFIIKKCSEDESDLLRDLSGPLCLNPGETLAELHDYILSYSSPFGSDDIKSIIVQQRGKKLLYRKEPSSYEEKIWNCLKDTDLQLLMKSMENKDQSLKIPSWKFVDVAQYITSVLSERPVNIGAIKSCCRNVTMLTDVFHFIVKINGEKHIVYKMMVYVYDGTYYFYIKNDKIKFSVPKKEGNISWIGSKENAIAVLSCFSELMSSVYGKFEIYHERTFENDKCLILSASDYFEIEEQTENIYEDATDELSDDAFDRTFYAYRCQASSEDDEDSDFEEKEVTDEEEEDFNEISMKEATVFSDARDKRNVVNKSECDAVNGSKMTAKEATPEFEEEDKRNTVNGSQCDTVNESKLTVKEAMPDSDEGSERNTVNESKSSTPDEPLFEPYHKEIADIIQSSTASKISSDTQTSVNNFSEGIIFESESMKAVLEAHLFDEEESSAFLAKSDNISKEDSGKKLEIYPSLRTKVELTDNDYVSCFASSETFLEDLDRLSPFLKLSSFEF